jgi:hypothetical protein
MKSSNSIPYITFCIHLQTHSAHAARAILLPGNSFRVVVIFCDVTSCSLVEVRRHFWRNTVPQTWRSKIKAKWPLLAAYKFLAWLILTPWKWRQYVPPKRRSTYSGLLCVIETRISCLLFQRADVGSTILRNVGEFYRAARRLAGNWLGLSSRGR